MTFQHNIKLVCCLIRYTITLILIGTSIFISKNVLEQYASKATSIKQYQGEVTANESVTLVLEFWPKKKTNYPNYVPYQLHEKWKMGTDFTLAFGVLTYRTAHEKIPLQEDIDEYEISHEAVRKVRFKRLVTKWGNCFQITADIINMRPPYRAFLQIVFDESVAYEDIPSVGITMSSEMNSYGKTMSDWADGNTILLDQLKGIYWTVIQPRKLILMKSKSECSESGFYNCLHDRLVEHSFQNCPRKCFSISTSGNATPICETAEEFLCSQQIADSLLKDSDCLPACSQTIYKVQTEFQEDLEKPDAKRNVTMAYEFLSQRMKVEEEFLVQDFVNMLTSIGGALGLCIGFSFLGGLSFILQQLQDCLIQFTSKRCNIENHQVIKVSPKLGHDNSNH